MTETIESPAKPHNCATDGPPHAWYVVKDDKGKEKKQTPDEAKKNKAAEANDYRAKDAKKAATAAAIKAPPPKPRFANDARSADFEAKSIAENEKKKPIDGCEVEYKCKNCPANTKVDIVFEDGQVAESQSETAENYDTDKRKSNQAKMLVDIQRQNNEERGTSHTPMAKFDGTNVGDPALAKKAAERRKMEFENVP